MLSFILTLLITKWTHKFIQSTTGLFTEYLLCAQQCVRSTEAAYSQGKMHAIIYLHACVPGSMTHVKFFRA